jgi:hypothetical protein
MARIRTIKPEFFTSEDIVEMPPLARLLYIALWCEADKEGRLSWKPKTFKMRYLPADECNIEDIAAVLVDRKLLILYGDGFAFIPSFKDHQHINPREKESVLPDPESTRGGRVSDASVTRREEGRKEGKGKETISPDADAPDDEESEEEKIERRKVRRGSDADYECAEFLFKQQRKANPTCKAPNFDTWANDIRLMREQDGRQHRDICELFKWAKADDFWSPNIQSPAKLREKWDVLHERRNRESPASVPMKKDWL